MTARHRRPHHPAAWILLGLPVLVAADGLLWAGWLLWHVWPLTLTVTSAAVAWYCWRRYRRALTPLTRSAPTRLIHSHVINDTAATDRAELDQLRDDNAKLRTKVRVLSDMLTDSDVRP